MRERQDEGSAADRRCADAKGTRRDDATTTQRRRTPRGALLAAAAVVVLAMFLRPALAPATIEEQRKRLPPPAHDCTDPVTGWWMGYQVLRNDWYRFILEVHRVEAGSEELTGNIEALVWDGEAGQGTPPPCNDNDHDQYLLDMPARGSYRNNHIEFIGQSYKVRRVICGHFSDYYPDGFSGDLILENTEFHTENDDGHNPITTVVFRRIKCEEVPQPVPDLPPPLPPSSSSGCGCF